MLRELPQKLGGLGVARHLGWAGMKARVLSREATRSHIYNHQQSYPGLYDKLDNAWRMTRMDEMLDEYRREGGLTGSWWDPDVLWVPPIENVPEWYRRQEHAKERTEF